MRHLIAIAITLFAVTASADLRVFCDGKDTANNDRYSLRIEEYMGNIYLVKMTVDLSNGRTERVDYEAQGTIQAEPLKLNLMFFDGEKAVATLQGGEKAHLMFRDVPNKMANLYCNVQ